MILFKLRRASSAAAGSPFRLLVRLADAARDEKRFHDAATLYGEALKHAPDNSGVQIQAGHMFKEAGQLAAAEQHYVAAMRLLPNDAELALQLGHFYKISGRLREAGASYRRAIALSPDWSAPRAELECMYQSGWNDEQGGADQPLTARGLLDGKLNALGLARLHGTMAPEHLPKPHAELMIHHTESMHLSGFGVPQNTFWGMMPVLRGVEAIRGFVLSEVALPQVEARINGLPIHRGMLKGPFELEYEPDKARIKKYVYNIWHDFSDFAPGLYELELSFLEEASGRRTLSQRFVVEPALREDDHPQSDAIINLDPAAQGTIEAQINARPSVIREAARPDLLAGIRTVLTIRPDQLGDLVASVPAILRLRELFPDATLIGLFSPANVDLARTLGVYDEIIVIDHRESLFQRTRTMPLEDQVALRDRLAPYNIDLAIDFAQSRMSRPLLGLTGAAFTYGFVDPAWPRLTASVDDAYHDPKNRSETATHSTRILAMINRLPTLLRNNARIVRRSDLPREDLRAFGIEPDDRFVVLHMGARIVFSRWPHYLALASRLLAETDLKIVLFTGDPDLRKSFTADLAGSERVVVLDGVLPFDAFDALLSYCAVYVGNDSGPKHLASLRGAPVVSIHSARISWNEWGQEQTGVIVSRKVPCAGCALYHDVDECGKDYVCVNGIELEAVYDAVRRYV